MSRKLNLSQKVRSLTARRAVGLSSLLAVLLCFAGNAHAASTTVVVNQVYGGGGNASPTYTNDYVELFNLSASTVSLNGYAVQYMSSAGTSSQVGALPNVTLQPGQHFLVQLAAGTTTTGSSTLPTPDASFNINLSASAGRVYLTSSTTALSGACPTSASIVDFVGYGSTTCFEGTKSAPSPSNNTTVTARVNQCSDTDQNGTDFAVVAPSPKNTTSTLQPCGGTSTTTITGAYANPASVTAGTATLLTASGSTGLSVTVDLSAFSGGSTTQQLFDDGTNGDVTANDGTYSYNFTVPSSTAAQNYSLKFTGKNNSTLATGSITISLTVTAPISSTPIHTIQGSTPGTTSFSGQTVQTSGIVTSTTGSGFYLQARDSDADSDPHTPEGIYIYTGSSGVPSSATVGTELQLTGKVALYPTTALVPGVEITGATNFTVLSTRNTLPAAITLSTTNPSPSGGIYQLPYLAGMRVSIPSITVTQPTDGTLNEPTETYTSNGQFWAEVTGLARPTREAGLDVRDPLTASQAKTIPRFDSDPETFLVDSAATGSANALNVSTGTVLNNVVGVIDLSSSGALPRVIVDAATHPTVAGGGMAVSVAPSASTNEVSIADQNMERFYNDQSTDNAQSAVTVTTAAYQSRLAKASLGVRNVLGTPDIIALEEMENIGTLNDLSAKISADAVAAGQPDPQYAAWLVQGNDIGGINVGFLTKPSKVNVIGVDQYGKTTTFKNASNADAVLNDRPPLVLHAGVKRANGASDYPVTVIVNHLRSLNGVTDPTTTGQTVRLKRKNQAEYLANLVQQFQSGGERVVVVGDFNAFDVNDGLVDSLGIIKGNPASADQDVLAGTSGLVNPVLIDAAPTDVPNGAYSYVFSGYAQSIDHFLVTQNIASQVRTVPAHWNADFPVIYRNDATRPEASSDHDGIVGYLTVPASDAVKSVLTTPAPGSTLTDTTVTFSWTAGTNVTNNQIYVGSYQGGLDYYSGNPLYATTSQTISGLPNDGSTVYVRLFSYINGTYQYNDYTYTAASQAPVKAALTSPAPGSTLPGTTVTFNWTAGTRVANYQIYVGSYQGGIDYYSGNPIYGSTSQTISGLPNDGSTVYVRLFSYINGAYQYNDYTYTAASQAPVKAALTSPAPGSTLPGTTVTFNWTAGTRVANYQIYVGSYQGGIDYYSGNPIYGATSQTVSGLPTDGSTVYVRLFSYINGSYQYNDYTYTAASQAPVKSAITSPAAGSTLPGSTVTFNWTPGTRVTNNQIYVGSYQGGIDYYSGNPLYGTTSQTISGLPTDGSTVYVRLFSYINGAYQYTDYTYTAATPQ